MSKPVEVEFLMKDKLTPGMNKAERETLELRNTVRLLEAELERLRLAGVQGIFWAAMAVGNYQTVYLQSIGFPATDFRLIKRHWLCRRYFCHDVLGHGERPYRQRA